MTINDGSITNKDIINNQIDIPYDVPTIPGWLGFFRCWLGWLVTSEH